MAARTTNIEVGQREVVGTFQDQVEPVLELGHAEVQLVQPGTTIRNYRRLRLGLRST